MDFDDETLRAIAQVYKEEGNVEFKKKEFRNALSFYTEGINVNCKDDQLNAILYTNRANSQFCLGHYQEALTDAKRAREFQPSYIKAIFRGAKACNELHLYEEAITWCDDGLAIEKDNRALLEVKRKSVEEQTKLKKGRHMDAKNKSDVVKDMEDERSTSFNVDPVAIIANLDQGNGDLTKVIEYYKVCLDICKDKEDRIREQDASANLGEVYCILGEYKVAMDYCQRSLTICKELGNRSEEGRVNGLIGQLHERLNDFKKAAEHFTISMKICQEVGDQSGEVTACGQLGVICRNIGDFKKAKEYLEKCILVAKEVEDRAKEQGAWGELGNVHTKMGNFNQAIKCFSRCLDFSQTVGNRALEGTIICNLGNACLGLGDLKGAMEHFEKSLVISKEVGNRAAEGQAYCNLGKGFCSLGNYKLAIQYSSQCLTICKELGLRHGEAMALTNLGNAYFGIGNFKQAIEFHQESLTICRELKDKAGEGHAFGNLGNAYQSLSDFKQAAEYFNRSLMICKEIGDEAHEGTMYGNLGGTFLRLGDCKEGIKYLNKHLEISKKVGDRAGEGRAYGSLSKVYRSLRKYEEAVDYHEQRLRIIKELGVRTQEGMAYRDLGRIHHHLGDFDQAKECYNESLAISKETGDRAGERDSCLDLSDILLCLGDLQQAMEFSKQHLNISKEMGDIQGEGYAYLYQGVCLQALGFPSDAVDMYQASVQQFNHVRRLLQSKDGWKIHLRNEYRMAYMALWNVLLSLDRTEEALVAAEKGRAQALVDLLVSHYGFESLQHDRIQDKTASEILTCTASNTVFLAIDVLDGINVWLLQDGADVRFSRQTVDTDVLKSNRGEDFGSFIKQTYKEIGVRSSEVQCEDRSLDALDGKDDLTVEEESDLLHLSLGKHLRKTRVDAPDDKTRPPPVHKNSLSILYDVIVATVITHLRGNELIIVPDGQLFLVPFAALQDADSRFVCESFRIRVIPSLTCLKLVTDVPLDHHCKSGALIVGDPWVQDIPKCSGKPKLAQLQFARKEAEMIGKIVKSPPLIGSEATKEEVLRRLNSVALIHLAAHGRIETGEIALAPNTSRTSQIPREEDFLLTMSDVLSVGLRARLVVLSCCYSGRGEIKDEGVVGIARAFLGAGARSVLVSLWAIDDEATLEFMRVFYQHLADGKTASESLNRATNHMRESQDFNRIKHWAPFVLIGDGVTLECSDGS